jgi:hypothetical protein
MNYFEEQPDVLIDSDKPYTGGKSKNGEIIPSKPKLMRIVGDEQ